MEREIKMDIKLSYVEAGQGPALIMLHGNAENNEFFEKQIEYFKDKYHCFAPDSRGHGKSPRGTQPLTIRQMAEDVIAFMDEHGIDKADILGFSDGGNIALILEMKYPERLGKVVLDGANLDLDGAAPWAIDYVLGEFKAAVTRADIDPEAAKMAAILNLMVTDPAIDPEELTAITTPTLVMAGTEDLILKEHTELIASKIPGAELVFIEGDHYCALQSPEAFSAAVDAFLSK